MKSELSEIRVTKANKLVEASLAESAVKLTLRDQKIILAVISQISPSDPDFKSYRLSIDTLAELTNIHKNTLYSEFERISARLASCLIKIKEQDEPKGFLHTNWFADIAFKPSKGYAEFSFSRKLKPYLIGIKDTFTWYYLSKVSSLQSVYSIRLYPLLRQYLPIKSVQNGKTEGYRIIAIDELKDILGVDKNNYPRFADFKRRVIIQCQKEISEKTDLAFDFEPVKDGRKITKLKFNIKSNASFEEVVEKEEVAKPELLPAGYDENVANMLLSEVPELKSKMGIVTLLATRLDFISASQACLMYTNAKDAGKEIKDPAAYFLGILKHQEQQAKNSHNPDMDDMSWANRADFDEF
ncbi:replication initiation protein [Zooshikella ganghwensis]|uniref:Replication initiation protein n=1 Tax=Zooshikella ganghwensis TaxID=202772 RepID=A0A4P9VEZ9_9GAMM|nr:replication initiation protein [Zooshikella ganghwensis]RDH41633.1 replication initiation protein [Zooshikella ganghwensis]